MARPPLLGGSAYKDFSSAVHDSVLKAATEDEVAGWHHWLNACEFEQTLRRWRTGKPGVLQPMGSQSRTQLSDCITATPSSDKKSWDPQFACSQGTEFLPTVSPSPVADTCLLSSRSQAWGTKPATPTTPLAFTSGHYKNYVGLLTACKGLPRGHQQ